MYDPMFVDDDPDTDPNWDGEAEDGWRDPDWYDDEDEDDFIDEWLDADGEDFVSSPPDPTWRIRYWQLREPFDVAFYRLRWALHPNRLRKCPVCHKRGKPYWRDGMCGGCWIPF